MQGNFGTFLDSVATQSSTLYKVSSGGAWFPLSLQQRFQVTKHGLSLPVACILDKGKMLHSLINCKIK